MRRIARQTGRPAVFLGDLASPKAGIAVLDGETELKRDLPSIAGFLARAFPGELTDYRRASPPQIGELRRRTILVLPDPPAGD